MSSSTIATATCYLIVGSLAYLAYQDSRKPLPPTTAERGMGMSKPDYRLTPVLLLGYHGNMSHELPNSSGSATIDLSGLPEPVVQSIKQLVDSLREEMPQEPKPTPQRPPLRGRFADLKLSIPKEDIDAAQSEAWATFPREFPKTAQS